MPSEKVLAVKQKKVQALSDLIKKSAAGVLIDYKGITVEEDSKLRKEMREAGVTYSVEKNTLLRLAFAENGLSALDETLKGTTAIALSETDQTVAARVLGKYTEKDPEKFNFKAGFIGEEIYDAAGVMALSKIPSKDVLLSMLLGALQGPIQKLAATIKAVEEKQPE